MTAAAGDDDHGGGDDVVLVEVAGDVEVPVDGVGVAEQPGLPRGRLVEALGEGEAVVAVPAPERRYVKPVVVVHRRRKKLQRAVFWKGREHGEGEPDERTRDRVFFFARCFMEAGGHGRLFKKARAPRKREREGEEQ